MEANGTSFLDRVLSLVKEDRSESVPLVQFKHPKDLEVLVNFVLTLPTSRYLHTCSYTM